MFAFGLTFCLLHTVPSKKKRGCAREIFLNLIESRTISIAKHRYIAIVA
jgi:hypothetical protein